MDNSNYFNNRHNDHLGVNKIGKSIRKSPSPQPNFVNPTRPQHQPQVYNINKNDFRNIVQQLTGSPSRHSQEPPRPRPPQNSPNPGSVRLQRIRPPGLAPININRPQMLVRPGPQMLPRGPIPFNNNNNNNNNNLVRPAQYGQSRLLPMVSPPMTSGDHGWRQNTADSPISGYMRYLQHSITESPIQSQIQSQQQPSPGFLPYPPVPPLPSPMINHPPPFPSGPSPRMNGPPPPPIPPSPTSPFFLASPSGYLNFLSPLSPYPLLSPAYQNPPPPLTPLFSFSPVGQSQTGILGPGPHPPPSPGMGFPLSPGFFQIPTPRWRD